MALWRRGPGTAAFVALALLLMASVELPDDDHHAHAAAPEPVCGSYRVPIKTLRDPGEGSVARRARASTVAALGRLAAPPNALPSRARAERQVWRLQAVRPVAMKLQHDGDIHLVVADRRGRTMITEFPAARCTAGAASFDRTAMSRARQALIDAFGPPPSNRFAKLSGTVSLQGIGFFDRLHNQLGAAPNGVELHPVLGFQAGPGAQAS